MYNDIAFDFDVFRFYDLIIFKIPIWIQKASTALWIGLRVGRNYKFSSQVISKFFNLPNEIWHLSVKLTLTLAQKLFRKNVLAVIGSGNTKLNVL